MFNDKLIPSTIARKHYVDEQIKNINNSFVYSTEEIIVGKWMDKNLYRKTFLFNDVVSGSTFNYDISTLNIEELFVDYSHSNYKSGVIRLPLNRTHTANVASQSEIRVTPYQITIICGSGISAGSPIVTLEYTKTTDK